MLILGYERHNPDASETFLPNLVHSVYTTPLPALLPHRLGLFLMILAIGAMVDTQRGPDRVLAEQYHSLSRIAMCEVPVMDDTSLDAVNALVSHRFEICISDPDGVFMLAVWCGFMDHHLLINPEQFGGLLDEQKFLP